MKAQLGISPIAWWNDDLAELSDDVSLDECLRQARARASRAWRRVAASRSIPPTSSPSSIIMACASAAAGSRGASSTETWRRSATACAPS
jgi:hypothetical protein